MTINVKGTTASAEADPAERYVLKDQQKSKTPVAIGLLLTGLAVYLKSMFPGWGSEDSPSMPFEAKDDAVPESETIAQLIVPQPAEQPGGTAEQSGAGEDETDGPSLGSAGRLSSLRPPTDFMPADSPPINFALAETGFRWEYPALLSAANDNPSFAPESNVGGPGLTSETDPDPEIENPDPDSDLDKSESEPDPDPDPDPDPVNRAPRVSGPVYLMDVTGCAILAIGLSDLLENAWDPDGDELSVAGLSVSSGTLTQLGDGWTYQGSPQLDGPVTVSYLITDGDLSVEQTAYFSVLRPVFEGTAGDDLLLGTMCADDIDGGRGDDNIDARAGDDVVLGGDGADHVVAGSGDDTVHGGRGGDIIFGGAGNDIISGGAGNDRLFGDEGDDIVFGDGGNDFLDGGDGDDLLSGGTGEDLIHGSDGDDALAGDGGNDVLYGDGGRDVLDGGDGDDTLHGGAEGDILLDGAGRDTLIGGEGDDTVTAAADGAPDMLDGGEGYDTVDYSAMTQGVSIDLAKGAAEGNESGVDSLSGFEAVNGGTGDDTVAGSDGNESLSGNAGDDTLFGRSGDDMLDGEDGDDLLEGGDGNDILSGGAGQDTVSGGEGDDTVLASADGVDDALDGGEGHSDTLDYSSTSQGVTVDIPNGTACGVEIGTDTISGFENVVGGSGDDHFVAGSGAAVLSGGAGTDVFEFRPSGDGSSTAYSTHEIVDFEVGDRVRMSKWDIFDEVLDELEDQFEDIYGDIDDDDTPIRFRHDQTEDMAQTFIETDLDRDGTWETTVEINGHHMLVVIEHA